MLASPDLSPAASRWPWLLLVVPLVLLVVGAALYDRRDWRDLAADEPTVLMAAESLIHDRDLRYERLDYDRHLVTRYGPPRDLDLASGSAGRRIAYAVPFVVPLGLSPWVAWRPETGFALGQALLLALAALASAHLLRKTVGPMAPVLLAVLIFGSASFAHVFFATVHPWLFVATLLAASLISAEVASAAASRPSGPSGPSPSRLLLAGALVSLPIYVRPLHLVLLPLFLLVLAREAPGPGGPEGQVPRAPSWLDRLQTVLPFGVGVGLGALGLALVQWWWGGGFRYVAGDRFSFGPDTGYPLVDFPAERWAVEVEHLAALVFDGAPRLDWGFDGALWAWNALFLVAGRGMGLLPYFLPLLLVFVLGRRGRLWPWVGSASLWALALLVFAPFTLGGDESLANPLFLPLYASTVLVWAPRREASPTEEERGLVGRWWQRLAPPFVERWGGALALGLSILISSLFLGRLWTEPGAPLVVAEPARGYAYPTDLARALLPEETSQKPLPAGAFVDHMGLRVRMASATIEESRIDLLTLHPPHDGRLWVTSGQGVERVILEFGADAPAELEVEGGVVLEQILDPGGGIRHVVEPSPRHHNLWWGPRRQSIFRFDFALVDGPDHPLYFRVVADPPLSSAETSP